MMRIMPRPGDRAILNAQEGAEVDPAILELLGKEGPILPRPKNKQVSVTSSAKELKDNQGMESGKPIAKSDKERKPLFPTLYAELARQKESRESLLAAETWSGGVGKDEKKVKQSQIERAYNSLNPADGFSKLQQAMRVPFLWNSYFENTVPPRPEEEMATPVEEAYFKHYLNIERDKELVPDTKSRIDWDKENAGNSEYVGIPQPVAQRVQAIADTLNTGRIYREYDKYKAMNPDLPSRDKIGEIYKFGKTLLKSDKGEQANEGMSVKYIERPDHYQQHATGLDVLGKGGFGLKWDKNNGVLKVYDTYDFPDKFIGENKIPQRKRPLRIREDIKFDPEKGSYLLRDNMKNYHEDESKYYE